MTKSTRWVRVCSCWVCNLTHRRNKRVWWKERGRKRRARARDVLLSHWLLGCLPLLPTTEFDTLSASYWSRFSYCFVFLSPCNGCHRFTVCIRLCSTIFLIHHCIAYFSAFLTYFWTLFFLVLSMFFFFFYFATLLSSFHHLQHSSVGLSLFGSHVKERDAGARALSCQRKQSPVFLCSASSNFWLARTKQIFFLAQPMPEPRKIC